jgi:hypothetical protein
MDSVPSFYISSSLHQPGLRHVPVALVDLLSNHRGPFGSPCESTDVKIIRNHFLLSLFQPELLRVRNLPITLGKLNLISKDFDPD